MTDDNVIQLRPGGRKALRQPGPDQQADPSAAILEAVEGLMRQGISPGDVVLELLGRGHDLAIDALGGSVAFDAVLGTQQPVLLPRRAQPVTFRLRVDIDDAKPPIWRRLDLPSDLTLDQLHDVLQVAMGWSDCHLHHFVMGPAAGQRKTDPRPEPFLTAYDVAEGEDDGINEADVRLDEVLGDVGDRLFYTYDFGDSWNHTLRLEEIRPVGAVGCITGRRGCPPEDCGGIFAYNEIAAGLTGKGEPGEFGPFFASREELLEWLPAGFDPAAFDRVGIDEAVRDMVTT